MFISKNDMSLFETNKLLTPLLNPLIFLFFFFFAGTKMSVFENIPGFQAEIGAK